VSKTVSTRIHNEFETTIKKVRSDNGSEFKIQELMSFVIIWEDVTYEHGANEVAMK